jgi:hypothetical protein
MTMRAEPAQAESPKLELPHDLLAAVSRTGAARKHDFRIEGWKPSLLGRVIELFAPRRSR